MFLTCLTRSSLKSRLSVTACLAFALSGVLPGTVSGVSSWHARYGMRSPQEVLARDYAIELTGWALKVARAVSDEGLTIVGKGINPEGKDEASGHRLRL